MEARTESGFSVVSQKQLLRLIIGNYIFEFDLYLKDNMGLEQRPDQDKEKITNQHQLKRTRKGTAKEFKQLAECRSFGGGGGVTASVLLCLLFTIVQCRPDRYICLPTLSAYGRCFRTGTYVL